MSSQRSKKYEYVNCADLLKELNGAQRPVAQCGKTAEKITDDADLLTKRKRSRLLKNPENRYVYSTKHRLLHDRDCPRVSAISDKHFRMLTDFPSDMRCCAECYRRALLRSGLPWGSADVIAKYDNTLCRLGASDRDLRELVVENGARFCGIGPNEVRLKVREDTWEIRKDGGTLCLYHNNYEITDDYGRRFGEGFHLQGSVDDGGFGRLASVVCGYSWPEHIKLLKEQEAENQRKRQREQLACVSNFARIRRFSLRFDYYSVLDCNGKVPRFFHRNQVPVKELEYEDRGNAYAVRLYRVPRRSRSRFYRAMDDLKEYSITANFPDYAERCAERIEQQDRSDVNECIESPPS